MPHERRKYQRFPFTLFALREGSDGVDVKIRVLEMSIGGCFVEWFDKALAEDGFCLKLPLGEGNILPLNCRIVYRFNGIGAGIQFMDITGYEQKLIGEVIYFHMQQQRGAEVDPFEPPFDYAEFAKRKAEMLIVDAA